MLAPRPAGRLVEQRILVEVRESREPLRGRAVPEHRPDGRREDLLQVQVDRPHRPVQVHVLVHEQPRRQEHLQGADPGLVQRETTLGDEAVPAQPLGVNGAHRDPGEVGVTADVVQVVHREHAGEQGLERPDPAGHCRVRERRLGDQEGDPARVDGLAVGEPVTLRDGAGRTPQAPDVRAQLALDDQAGEILVAEGLGAGPARVCRGREHGEEPVVEEVRARPCPTSWRSPAIRSVSTTSPSDGTGSPGARAGRAVRSEGYSDRPHSAASCMTPRPCVSRECSAVGNTQRALWKADPAQALDPGGVEQVLLGPLFIDTPYSAPLPVPTPMPVGVRT